MIAVDTNVLIYAVAEDDPHHTASRRLVEAVAAGLLSACVFPQNLLEFYAVTTNPRRMARPLTSAEAMNEIATLRAIFLVAMPKESSVDRLAELTASTCVTAANIFDAFIVAQMLDTGIDTVCTYNARDFERLPVRASTPEDIMGSFEGPKDGSGFVQDRPRCP